MLLLVSGCGWLMAHFLLHGPAEFPGAPQPSEPWWLRLHGAAAMGFLVAFGAVLPQHVRSGWRQHVNRATGLLMLSVVCVLILTAYGLYYVGDDRARAAFSVTHWSVGLAAAALLVLHVVTGRRLNRRLLR